MSDDFDNELDYEADLVTLVDEDGQEFEFEILDELENDDGHFLALIPTDEDPEELASEAQTYFIAEIVEENGEELIQEVMDDELGDRLAKIFESRFNEMYFSE